MGPIYLIGSLRNPAIPNIGTALRDEGYEVFDDWHAAGPMADDAWQEYETLRGRTYGEALQGYAANNVFDFDFYHLMRCSTVVLVMPAGKSGHLEFGWSLGQGKKGYVLFDQEPDRWDVMYQFADGVAFNTSELIKMLKHEHLWPA